jgi:hypothetical protein
MIVGCDLGLLEIFEKNNEDPKQLFKRILKDNSNLLQIKK